MRPILAQLQNVLYGEKSSCDPVAGWLVTGHARVALVRLIRLVPRLPCAALVRLLPRIARVADGRGLAAAGFAAGRAPRFATATGGAIVLIAAIATIATIATIAAPPANAQRAPAAQPASAAPAAIPGAASPSKSASAAPPSRWISVARTESHITARELGLVINTADPYSVEVGAFYAATRKLPEAQILRIALPVKAQLNDEELQTLAHAIDARFGASVQALALAWTTPYAVGCHSITAALTLGVDAGLCAHTCSAPRQPSRYFNTATARPFTDLKLRPSMLLAAPSVDAGKALIRRGLQADSSLGLRGGLPAHAHFVDTSDRLRSARTPLFPPAGALPRFGIEVHLDAADALAAPRRVLMYQTGLARVAGLDKVEWVPGALADHLTSFGGVLDAQGANAGQGAQMSALAWIGSGATASYGTVSEPCSHPQKFPHPQVLLLHYLQGASAIEAYWKSVAWPQQGVFIGDPLAAPFARR
jgi:uncharacterized protein (TIGR03790 family)